jgi:hypothetical protein
MDLLRAGMGPSEAASSLILGLAYSLAKSWN